MRRDILLLLGAVFFASVAGYTYLHNPNLQVSAGFIFVGTFLLSWAKPQRFLVFALITASSIFLANVYATTNQLNVPSPPGSLAETLLALIPATVAGLGGMIIGGGVSKLPDNLGRPTDAVRVASLEATADMEGSGAQPDDASRPQAATQRSVSPSPSPLSGLENTPTQEPRPFA